MSSILDTIKPRDAVKALQDLEKSLGWALIKAYLDKDMMDAVRGFGTNPNMTEAEMHYRRGAIFATDNFEKLPRQLHSIYETNLALDKSNTDEDT
jgi:hypothetical protein